MRREKIRVTAVSSSAAPLCWQLFAAQTCCRYYAAAIAGCTAGDRIFTGASGVAGRRRTAGIRDRLNHAHRHRCVELRSSAALVGAVALVGAAGLADCGKARRTLREATDRERPRYLIGAIGVVLDLEGDCYATRQAETWKVRSGRVCGRRTRVRVTGIEGLVLEVEPEEKDN